MRVPSRSGRRAAGFTLVEMATALMIVALAVAVAVPAFRSLGDQDDLTRAARRVETLFQMARDSAIRSGRPVTIVVDSLDGLVWIDSRAPLGLEQQEVREALAYPEDEEDAAPRGMFRTGTTEGEVVFEHGQPIGLPSSVRMELLRARATFTFEPGGRTLGDTIVLSGVLGSRTVTVDPWTGDVLVR